MERNYFITQKILVGIFFAYALAIIFFGAVFIGWVDHKYGFPVHDGGDSALYMRLAENLIDKHAFTLSSAEPLEPEALRAPGYPGLVALTLLVFGTPFMVAIIQFAMSAITGYFIFDIAKDFANKKIALLTGFLFWLNPSVLFYSNTLLSDIFFVFLEMFAFWLIYRKKEFKFHLLAFLIIGTGVLVRPAASFLVIPFALIYFIAAIRKTPAKQAVLRTMLCLFMYAAIVVPWMYRNYQAYKAFTVSSIGPYTLLFYDMDAFKSSKGYDMEVVRSGWVDKIESDSDYDIYSPFNFSKTTGIFIEEVVNDPSYLIFHLKGSARFFVLSGLSDVLTNFEYDETWPIRLFKWGERFMMLFLMLAMLIAPVLAYRKSRELSLFIAFSFVIAIYTALVFGPIPNARYRLAALPFILIPAAYSLQILFEKQIFYRKRNSIQ